MATQIYDPFSSFCELKWMSKNRGSDLATDGWRRGERFYLGFHAMLLVEEFSEKHCLTTRGNHSANIVR